MYLFELYLLNNLKAILVRIIYDRSYTSFLLP